MEYTVSKLARLSGISTRTLRYYDEIGLLKPLKINSSGYRIYGKEQVNRLQQILFYKTMEVPLEKIGAILDDENFNPKEALYNHYQKLLDKKEQINTLILNIEKTISELEGGSVMSDQEKFNGFKEDLIRKNEKTYGAELRETYGHEVMDNYNDKLRKMTEHNYKKAEKLSIIILEKLKEGLKEGHTQGELAKEIFELHKEWIMHYWNTYSKEGHKGLGDMYVSDQRFKEYYDKEGQGMAQYLRDIIHEYAK